MFKNIRSRLLFLSLIIILTAQIVMINVAMAENQETGSMQNNPTTNYSNLSLNELVYKIREELSAMPPYIPLAIPFGSKGPIRTYNHPGINNDLDEKFEAVGVLSSEGTVIGITPKLLLSCLENMSKNNGDLDLQPTNPNSQ